MPRTDILRAARHVCETHGVAGLTMRRIAAEAGITAPAIYRHFPAKADVLQALVDRANERFAEYLARAADDPDLRARLRRTYDAVVDFALDDPTSYDVLFNSRERRDPDLDPDALRSRNFRTAVERVEACQAAGLLRRDHDAVTIALALWAQVQGLLAMHLQGRFGGSPPRLRARIRACLDLLMRGVIVEPQ